MISLVGPEVVFFVQARDQRFHRGHWCDWWCSSPHYSMCRDARANFEQRSCETMWPEQLRLVRGEFWYEKVPLKTPLYASHSSKLKVLARKAAGVSRLEK